jgi:hypothetical protein
VDDGNFWMSVGCGGVCVGCGWVVFFRWGW